MASSIKIILRQKKSADGLHPLAIRITVNRKSSYVFLGYAVSERDWDSDAQKVKKSHPNSVRLNHLLLKKKAEISESLITLQTEEGSVTSATVRNEIKPKIGITFFAQASLFIENMRREGKYNRVKTDQCRLDHFREFLKGNDIAFSEITIPLLNKFRAWLKGTRNVSERTIINHLILIRTIYNQAIRSGIIDNKAYPFGKDKISIKFPESVKIGLLPDEVKAIEELDLSNDDYLNHARTIWLFSFYFAGVRVSDVLRMKWSDFQNDRLYYAMGKNAKAGSLKTPDKALKLIQPYKTHPKKHDLIFPELKVLDSLDTYHTQRKISYAVKRLNKALAEIATRLELTKPLTMHISRHTFGNISGERIPIQMLQKLYRHSSITTTIGYQSHFIHKTADEALDSVIGS